MHIVDVQGDRVYIGQDPSIPLRIEGSAFTPLHKLEHLDRDNAAAVIYSYPLTWPTFVQLSYGLYDATMTPAAQAAMNELANQRFGEPPEFQISLPDGFTPYPWQLEGARRFGQTGIALLADSMGTGKTFTGVMSMLQFYALHPGTPGPGVVVCPASVIPDWIAAFQRFGVSAIDFRGRTLPGKANVLVTSYQTSHRREKALSTGGVIIYDESHKLTNRSSKQSMTASRLGKQAAGRIALSGTPFTHAIDGLQPTLRYLELEAWPSNERFVERYCETQVQAYGQPAVTGIRRDRRDEFDTALAGTYRHVSKAEALPFLPKKVYHRRYVELPADWMKAYRSLRDEMIATLPEESGDMVTMETVSKITRLQQLAAAPCDVWTEWEPNKQGESVERMKVRLKHDSWKVAELLEVMNELEDHEQVAVYSTQRQLVELAEERLNQEGYSTAMLSGRVAGKARQREIEAFQAGDRKVILVTAAGQEGVTLTAASTAVFLSRPYSYVASQQMEDRQHRIGSERHDAINIIDIIAKGTIDNTIRNVVVEKASNLADFLKNPTIAAEVLGGTLSI